MLGVLILSVFASAVLISASKCLGFPSYLLVPITLQIPVTASEASLTFSLPLALFNMGISSTMYILTDLQSKCVGVTSVEKLVTESHLHCPLLLPY